MRVSFLARSVALISVALILGACNDDHDDTTIRDVTPPLITTDSNFADGYTAVAAVFVSGAVEDAGGIKTFTYQVGDDIPKTLDMDANGQFNAPILLHRGKNKVTLSATDMTGNTMRLSKRIYVGDTIAAGNGHTGVLRDGKLYGFGRNNFGQTGLGMTTTSADTSVHPVTPTLMSRAPNNLISINYNQNHSLAVDDNGQVYSWGEDKYGQLGRGDANRNDCSKAEAQDCRLDIGAIIDIEDAVTFSAGYRHNLVLDDDGTVWAMGRNAQGQLGNGTTSDSSTPVQVDFSKAPNAGRIIQVVASADSSYALDDKGQVWGWGSDDYANLGRGSACKASDGCTTVTVTPTLIPVIKEVDANHKAREKVTQLAAGRDHILALTNKESVYGWGLNATSQVGYNGVMFKETEKAWDKVITTPTKLPWFDEKEVRRIYANGNASYAVLEDGTVYPWGMFGETNDTGKTIYNHLDEPSNKLPSLKNIDNMAMGIMHLIAHEKPKNKTDDGQLFTWGWSFDGSLGSDIAAHIWMYNTPIAIHLPE